MPDYEISRTISLIIKVTEFLSRITMKNLWLWINSTQLVLDKALVILQALYVKFSLLNSMSALLRVKKDISKTTSMLITTNMKALSKNQIFSLCL